MEIEYLERQTNRLAKEKVFGGAVLKFLYRTKLGKLFLPLISRIPIFSWAYGAFQKLPFTKKKITPFVKKFGIDPAEFEKNLDEFDSFNDFFVRKLKKEARPILGEVVIPADGRYLFFPNIQLADGFLVKGKKFSLGALLQDDKLAKKYENGTMVFGRLCPTDYHRFFFPCSGTPSESKVINGYLYSVNPVALKQNIQILTENKRSVCSLKTEHLGNILYLEVGATNVGSIHQTYRPNEPVQTGQEKGFFSFGASMIILLFEPGKIVLDRDLLDASSKKIEVLCLYGQRLAIPSET